MVPAATAATAKRTGEVVPAVARAMTAAVARSTEREVVSKGAGEEVRVHILSSSAAPCP